MTGVPDERNFSRYSHQPDRRYTRVDPYQGAMASDADQIESADIARRNDETLGDLAIGSGVPQVDGLLAYATAAGPPDIIRVAQVIPGRVLADGRWGVLRLRAGTTLGSGRSTSSPVRPTSCSLPPRPPRAIFSSAPTCSTSTWVPPPTNG